MKVELDSLTKNKTWNLFNTPAHSKLPVGDCKWLYKIKLGPNGNPIRYKVRLVSKGFSQVPDQDLD